MESPLSVVGSSWSSCVEQPCALSQEFHRMQYRLELPLFSQMTTDLQAAADIGARDYICSSSCQIRCFDLA